MKKKYSIYRIEERDLCVPSDNYYSRSGDWIKQQVNILIFIESFDTYEEAETFILTNFTQDVYTIKTVYLK